MVGKYIQNVKDCICTFVNPSLFCFAVLSFSTEATHELMIMYLQYFIRVDKTDRPQIQIDVATQIVKH